MNTNPDESRLALWLEDELHGEDLAAFERWVADRPEHFAAREEVRQWRKQMAGALPSIEDPPYPDFFNHRVERAIRALGSHQRAAAPATPRQGFSWRAWLMPAAACAGMALTFWIGAKTQAGPPEIDVTGAPRAIPVEPILYTPERGVSAEWFASTSASATVIVLNGVAAIPDSTDFSATAFLRDRSEMDATARLEPVTHPQEP